MTFESSLPHSFCCLFEECLLIRFSGAPVFGHVLHAQWLWIQNAVQFLVDFPFFLNWVASIPKGFELRDVPRYPEMGSLLKGSSSGNACICPVGAEFWWGRVESNLLIAVVFQFPHYFYESACILRPCSEIECGECNSACAPLGIAQVLVTWLTLASHASSPDGIFATHVAP